MPPRRVRWLPVLALAAFGLFLFTPLFRWRAFCADDLLPHIHKAYSLERLISDGHWLPRWSPDLARGYGYPLFNFYAPLSSYPLVALHWLGLPYSAAIQVLMGLMLLAAGIAMYAFVRDLFGEWPGFAAGVAYMAAPYLGYDIFYRGALAEVFGWIWLPLILWGIYRAARDASWQWVAIAALCYAALLPSHNVLALISTPLFAGWCIVVAKGTTLPNLTNSLMNNKHPERSAGAVRRVVEGAFPAKLSGLETLKRTRFGGIAIALGLTIAASFWLPALLERDFVRIDRLLDPPLLQYHTNFISLQELLSLPRNFDPLLANPSPPRALGLLFVLFTLPVVFTLARHLISRQIFNKRPEPVEGRASSYLNAATSYVVNSYFIFALLAYALMTLDISQPLWDIIPLLSFVQFPWRMLAPASACAAVLVGAGVAAWSNSNPDSIRVERRTVLLALAPSVLLVIAHLSWFTPLNCGPLLSDTSDTLRQLRAGTFQEGAYGYSEYLPATVQAFPTDDTVYNALIAGDYPDRLLVEGITTADAADPLDATYTLDVVVEQQAVYRQFWYPGWQVELDSKPVTIEPDAQGLIIFTIPSGQHSLHVYFGETPLRLTADALSLIGLLTCTALFIFGLRQKPVIASVETRPKPSSDAKRNQPVSPTPYLAAAIATILLALFRFTVSESSNTAFNGEQVAGSIPLRASFAGGVEIYGYTLPDSGQSGQSFDVSVYVGIRQPVESRYVPSISIEDAQRLLWNGPQIDFPRWLRPPYTADAWTVGQYAQWARRVTLLPGTPPGQYHVWATIYDADTLAPDSLIDANGNPTAPRVELGLITVTRPWRAAAIEDLDVQTMLKVELDDSISLLGYSLDRAEARPGDTALLTLFWKANRKPELDMTANIQGINGRGEVVYQTSLRPVGDAFPTSHWQTGDVWRGQHLLRLPADLETGDYQWRIGLGDDQTATAGTIHVTAPNRVFTQPVIHYPVNAQLGSFAELVGYSINGTARPGEPVAITLLWRGLATPEVSYSAFIHLSDGAGRVWAQSDGIPANWSRPTTGWVTGEYILDERTLTLPADMPPGNYSIFVGMADVLTGERALINGPAATDDSRINLGPLIVEN